MSLGTYNSTVNVAGRFGNTTLIIRWLGIEYQFEIPSGYYSADDFSNFISFSLLSSKLYMNDSNGKMISLITVEENPTAYAIQLNISPIPTATQATTFGYTKPAGASWGYPVAAETPQLIFGSVSQGKLFGFQNSLTQPPVKQSSAYVKLSPDTPTISPVSSYLVTCNAINSRMSLLPTLLGQITLNAGNGSLVQYSSQIENAISMRTGVYTSLVFHLLSQDLVHLTSDLRKDPELAMVILLETPV